MAGNDTIFALSSGNPPAGIAVIRISGPRAADVLELLGGRIPRPRRASVMRLRDPADRSLLDETLVLSLPGPASATGEDCAELHLHGGRALVARVQQVLSRIDGLRRAEPGEFTLRAFRNGRIDLAEAEGLADLLSAETELQLRNAQALSEGVLSQRVQAWREELLGISARVETAIDFADEEDAVSLDAGFAGDCLQLAERLGEWLDAPRAEILREGYRVAIGGPPNAGKSSLFNALIEEDAAIATPIAGTTRDALHRPVALGGVPFLFVDTAGLRDETGDVIEAIGIQRAADELARADLVLWLGEPGQGPDEGWQIATKIDIEPDARAGADFRVSSATGEGIDALRKALVDQAREAMPKPGQIALHDRQAGLIARAHDALVDAGANHDLLLVAEGLRRARTAFDQLLGRTGTEDMLDALFGRFCIGK
ncbi:tRNA uridine-5-carboxymethylaminomethyl(34) synthesis GTPase MnmE [Croceicoccus marinus]|jgi:tRNA modification GTPase|uniref:tRNA modification GTPase MnmE n=1 Tax=Croceicoccus marinus TaxID=450378 RepID=A0A7G6VV13_9SPHN|nr:tRNA uridine-5-carboxymethylaminomethyl(34) synthesis GTPase MnmE [Croceicoccus marinus]QNE05578.1 tRNA uridine-5-carboxymethylaminomethyl(34) synthesis GTPase MnmE [Croceicoccus marinus]